MHFERLYTELLNTWPRLLSGFGTTILVSIEAIAIGSIIGLVLGHIMFFGRPVYRLPGWLYLDFVRGTPVLVLILAAYYILPLGVPGLDAQTSAMIALAVFCSAQVTEVVRGGLSAVPRGQDEAAKSIGLPFVKRLRYVILPQAMRQAVPAWINTAVEIIKATSLLAVIGVPEVMLVIQQIVSRNYMNAEFYLVAGLIYLSINFTLERIGKTVERRLRF
ncbi:amino acid ABC transporter permease [Brucella intermedia]|uniref:amino acid ABC transporter permease n=1 Tax=Brucella intermedia TaxID=94625 RepID=UPI00224A7C8D|nr:amino acid ABC transporter permease [Brucella intermedia]